MVLTIEASGCITKCEHCYAQGGAEYAMPLDNFMSVLQKGREFCDETGLAFDLNPMHDVLTHPDAAEMLLSVGRNLLFHVRFFTTKRGNVSKIHSCAFTQLSFFCAFCASLWLRK